jgi:hypothetical protein
MQTDDLTILVEPVCYGLEHVPTNTAMLASATHAWPGRVAFMGERTHVAAVRSAVPVLTADVAWFELDIPARRGLSRARRLASEWMTFSRVAREATRARANRVVVTAASYEGVHIARLVWGALRVPIPLVVVIHGVLSRQLASRATRWVMEQPWPRKVQFVVLGDDILQAAARIAPGLTRTTGSIEHPYCFDDVVDASLFSGPLRFGFLGLASRHKGYPEFVAIAEHTRRVTPQAEFHLVGGLGPDCANVVTTAVKTHATGDQLLDRTTYARLATACQYLVYPFRVDAYTLTSSASFLDTLKFVRPVLALNGPPFVEHFRRFGDIGYLCDDLKHLQATIGDLASKPLDRDRYAAQQAALVAARRVFSPEAVGEQLAGLVGCHRVEGRRRYPAAPCSALDGHPPTAGRTL